MEMTSTSIAFDANLCPRRRLGLSVKGSYTHCRIFGRLTWESQDMRSATSRKRFLTTGGHMNKLFFLILTIALTGCATYSQFSPTGAGVMAWKNDLSAALVVPGSSNNAVPRACMQMALTMNDVNSKTTASISDAILKVFEKIPRNATLEELAKISSELTKTAKALNVSTERTAFLMVGSFYICQFQANGMAEANVKEVATALISAAANINSENTLPITTAPAKQNAPAGQTGKD